MGDVRRFCVVRYFQGNTLVALCVLLQPHTGLPGDLDGVACSVQGLVAKLDFD